VIIDSWHDVLPPTWLVLECVRLRLKIACWLLVICQILEAIGGPNCTNFLHHPKKIQRSSLVTTQPLDWIRLLAFPVPIPCHPFLGVAARTWEGSERPNLPFHRPFEQQDLPIRRKEYNHRMATRKKETLMRWNYSCVVSVILGL
jgi:hypothetical protein